MVEATVGFVHWLLFEGGVTIGGTTTGGVTTGGVTTGGVTTGGVTTGGVTTGGTTTGVVGAVPPLLVVATAVIAALEAGLVNAGSGFTAAVKAVRLAD